MRQLITSRKATDTTRKNTVVKNEDNSTDARGIHFFLTIQYHTGI